MGSGCSTPARLAALMLTAVLAACAAARTYVAAEDAPAYAKDGYVDPRLALTRVIGAPLAPIVRNLRAPHGRLHGRAGLERFLRDALRPLDIVVIRSRPAATRLLIPGHFTHATVWLGTPAEMRALGAWSLSAVRPYRERLRAGRPVFEAARDAVQLSPMREITDVDEIVILRPRPGGRGWAREKYAGLFTAIGRPFDYNFDWTDKARLTCAELVAGVFPEFELPVRYTQGRYAIVPDDIVRAATVPGSRLRIVRYVAPAAGDGFSASGGEAVLKLLSRPRDDAT
ncbi:YiiX/YebB-like N1pC/P60 family cysteine hydrolase [Nitratireductor alexandrii]|uniref:YiiX/YebB-like N1pC/P60 family cysteine hydrolase n=1 Tax=Nitratireductor alexandrii TaxID=2448161 RepID=UPI000FDB58F4|nr:YiiX/YebB-like N1pC/P60 family cysteine hydrolase [Nitratireductor alexandrii]